MLAREPGYMFDAVNGTGWMNFNVARAMLDGEFRLRVIRSDVHSLCIDGQKDHSRENVRCSRYQLTN